MHVNSERKGWAIVAGLTLAIAITGGLTYFLLGIYLEPVVREFGATHEQGARSISLFVLMMTVCFPAVGWLFDRGYARAVIVTGTIMLALGYLFAAQSHSINAYVAGLAFSGVG